MRAKQIAILVDISIRIGKNWSDVIKEDIDKLIRGSIIEFETQISKDLNRNMT